MIIFLYKILVLIYDRKVLMKVLIFDAFQNRDRFWDVIF